MIDYAQVVWLALIQGLTEFLPISSSAHLILLPRLIDWPDQGLAFDVAVHTGTLIAVVAYLRNDLKRIACAWFAQWGRAGPSVDSRLGWLLIVATVPAVIVGLLMDRTAESALRDPKIIALATLIFALVLWWADRQGARRRAMDDLGIKDAIGIGLAQAVALIPGVSRSGITMTAGLMLGLSRRAAARFSFLMAVPVIAAAAWVKLWAFLLPAPDPLPPGSGHISIEFVFLGIGVSFVSAWLVIALFIRFIERVGMLPFVLYRLALGSVLLFIYW